MPEPVVVRLPMWSPSNSSDTYALESLWCASCKHQSRDTEGSLGCDEIFMAAMRCAGWDDPEWPQDLREGPQFMPVCLGWERDSGEGTDK